MDSNTLTWIIIVAVLILGIIGTDGACLAPIIGIGLVILLVSLMGPVAFIGAVLLLLFLMLI